MNDRIKPEGNDEVRIYKDINRLKEKLDSTISLEQYLNDHVLRPEDRIQFDWGMRTINILLWPYIMSVFILDFMRGLK